jgi:hypothetical protein
LHGLLTNKNKNSGEKIQFGPPSPGPLGAILGFFSFLENIRRRSGRVLKLQSGFILTKKEDINPPNNLKTLPGSLGGIFRFFSIFV